MLLDEDFCNAVERLLFKGVTLLGILNEEFLCESHTLLRVIYFRNLVSEYKGSESGGLFLPLYMGTARPHFSIRHIKGIQWDKACRGSGFGKSLLIKFYQKFFTAEGNVN